MKTAARIIALIVSMILLVTTVVWASIDLTTGTLVTALFAILAFLSAFSGYDKHSGSPRFRLQFRRRYEDIMRTILGFRYRRLPLRGKHDFYYPTNRRHDRHRIGVSIVQDRDKSGLIKSLIHLPPNADPYDILTFSGAGPNIRIEDLNGDGKPELFIDYAPGAHTHIVSLFRLDAHERFILVPGSEQYADWGPVTVEYKSSIGKYVINLLRGPGAAGSNAVPKTYVIEENEVVPQ